MKKDRATACLRLLSICSAQSLSAGRAWECWLFMLSQGECRNILQIAELLTQYAMTSVERKLIHGKYCVLILASLKIRSWLQGAYGMSPGIVSMANSLPC